MIALVPLAPLALALGAASLALWQDREHRGGVTAMAALAVVAPLAAIASGRLAFSPWWPALAPALVIGLLARERDNPLPSESALKLLWVLGPALALSWAAVAMLGAGTGTLRLDEQWAVLAIGTDVGIEPGSLWTAAVPLSLLAGVVMLGGAPFHFWPSDLVQGARPWIAPFALVAIQACGAAWIGSRLEGIDAFPPASRVANTLLVSAAAVALLVGAVSLVLQRRPERRVGSLASLNGSLVLASLAVARGGVGVAGDLWPAPRWSAHLALALTGAALLARFVPVSERSPAPSPVLFRRHPVWGAAGLYAMGSLAGVPGTPGALLWLDTARALARTHRTGLLLLLGLAWVMAFATVARQTREAFGTGAPVAPTTQPVPREARWAMAIAAFGLVLLMAGMLWPFSPSGESGG
jgi:NADH:ubiquinone oxidoreductase subunit 2 (subunit N)